MTLVNASRETVWDVLVDYPRHRGLYPRVTTARVLEAGADHAVVRYVAMAARTVLPAFLTRGAERDGLVETVRAVRERAEGSR
jgi:hypothetical protein